MKLLVAIVLITSFFSCKKDSIQYASEFEKSKQAWNSYKASIGNSYSYIIYSGSVFGGYAETKITVRNGAVKGRSYLAGSYVYNQGQAPLLQIMRSWTEDSAALNTHQEGDAAVLLDEIYAQAPTVWLNVEKKKNDVYFTSDSIGLITSCGYVPKGCQDDCFIGVHIKSITPL
ncbi:hypothetical protein QTN47_01490 [Danxiaibacter flavus]|uniref:Uncharacterized protein n=1 Tax=Danxiaibacter flavus TaxID=3049108 RepID=A0ABV3ZA95_9BACT|nr:hypothetical protein QNM32_01490 [Chitinophagaceae bacterium DXS]